MHYQHLTAVSLLAFILTIVGCATGSSGDGRGGIPGSSGANAKIEACRAGDTAVSGPNQCLQDGAACYQTRSGNWCTGERGNTCPTGSVQIPIGTACPNGMRCFEAGESLYCGISYQ